MANNKIYYSDKFIKTGGTSSQYLMADGTVSSGSTGNTTIGTDTDLTTSGATVVDDINLTDGVVTAHSTRTLTLANLGYTGDTDANNYVLPFTDNSSNWNTAFGWGDHSTEGYVTSSGNTVIGTDSDINTGGYNIIDTINMTDGVIQSHTTRDISNLKIEDTRDAEKSPNDYMDHSLSLDFTDEFGSLGAWWSGLTLKGWDDNYQAWQLISGSDTSADTKLYFRQGVGTSWGAMNEVWHSGSDGAGSGLDADKLDAQEGTYYLDYNNFTNTPNLWDLTAKKTSINIDTEGDDNFWQYAHATQTTDGTHAGSYQYVVNFGDKSQGIQLSHTFGSSPNNLYFRSGSDNSSSENGANAYSDWRRILTTDDAYTHPTHPGDDISIDTTALTGAVVISDLDLNVTTDTLGHVTDANATVATRTLTLADLGFTGDTNANNSTPRTDEEIRDVAAAQWIDGTNTTVVVDDAANTIKINATGSGGGIDGSGTVKMIPKFSDSDTLTDSNIFEANSGEVHINTTTEYIGMLNVYQDTTAPALMLIADDGGSSASPIMYMHRDSSSPADDDILGRTTYAGNDSSGSNVSYARIDGYIDTALTGSTNAGGVHLQSRLGATMYTNLRTGGNKSYADNTWYFDTEIQAEDGIKIYSGSTITLDSDSGTSGEVLVSKGASTPEWEHRVRSNTSEGGTGSVQVGNIVKITQSAYDSLGSKDADTIYFIVG